MRNFRNLKIWEKGMEITNEIYHLSKKLSGEESMVFALK